MSEQASQPTQQTNTAAQQTPNHPTEQSKPEAPSKETAEKKKQRFTGYSLYEHTQFKTTNQLRDRRKRAILSKEISLALFGRRRFRRIDIVSALNNFYASLLIATMFHKRVAGLYLIIELEKLQYVQFADSKDTQGQAKEHTVFRITLTRYPTEKDRSSIGFNEAHKAEDITNLIEGLLQRKQRKRYHNRKDKRPRNQDKGEREPRDQRDRQQRPNKERKDKYPRETKHREQNKQTGRDNRNDYNDRPVRKETQDKDRQDIRAKREKDEYQDRTRRNRYREEERRDNYPLKRYEPKEEDKKEYRPKDNQKTYHDKPNKEKQQESKYRQKKQDEGNYIRGQTRSRGTGRIAPHNYEPSHIRNEKQQQSRRNEDRGHRKPRRNRYSDDEDQ